MKIYFKVFITVISMAIFLLPGSGCKKKETPAPEPPVCHRPQPQERVDGFAVGVAAGVGEFMAQVDEVVAGEGERLVVQSRAQQINDGVCLAAAAGT